MSVERFLGAQANLNQTIMDEKNYICLDEMAEQIFDLLKEERESWRDETTSAILDTDFSDENIEERALCMAIELNADMKKYLHFDDHKIYGNFNDVEYDYIKFRTGEYSYNTKMFSEMIKRLDDGEESKQANEDREFLTEWFFDTFGTRAISYNFGEEINEAIYDNQKYGNYDKE
jgi:hypothetical protein